MSREDFEKYSKKAEQTLREAFNFSNVTGKDFSITFTPILNSSVKQALQIELKSKDKSCSKEEKSILEANCKSSFKNFFAVFPTLSPIAPAFSSSYGITTAGSPLANIGINLEGSVNNQNTEQTHPVVIRQADVFQSLRFIFSGNVYMEYFQSKQYNPM